MARYDYKCEECKHVCEVVLRMCSAAEAPPCYCPLCGYPMHRQVAQVHTDLKDFHTPISMYSVACNSVEEIRQMQAAGVPISDDPHHPDYGVPQAHNRHQKKAALRAAGFVETN